jgi:ferredoxin
MLRIFRKEKKKQRIGKDQLVYQYANGNYLPSSSQIVPMNSKRYTPHKSTRYKNVIIGSNGVAQILINGQLRDSDKKLPELYEHRENCCGCTACYAICPLSGSINDGNRPSCITMEADEEGFLYPVVNASVCIRCYRCILVCSFKEKQKEKGYL